MLIMPTPIPDLMVVETKNYLDSRGKFGRLYCERELVSIIGHRRILQINYSHTRAVGAVRGLHFQHSPNAEMKMVRCIRGRVWDVAVDLRRNSSTYLKWHGVELSPENMHMMVIPEGFAHGFQVMEPDSELLYLHTACYSPESEAGVRYDDPALAIRWPLNVTDISERDAAHQLLVVNS